MTCERHKILWQQQSHFPPVELLFEVYTEWPKNSKPLPNYQYIIKLY